MAWELFKAKRDKCGRLVKYTDEELKERELESYRKYHATNKAKRNAQRLARYYQNKAVKKC